jgi:hypothetical protein
VSSIIGVSWLTSHPSPAIPVFTFMSHTHNHKHTPKVSIQCCHTLSEPSISVSIVSGYGLDDWEIDVKSSAEVKGFFL